MEEQLYNNILKMKDKFEYIVKTFNIPLDIQASIWCKLLDECFSSYERDVK